MKYYKSRTSISPALADEISLDKTIWYAAYKLAQEHDRRVWQQTFKRLKAEAGESYQKLVAERATLIFKKQKGKAG